MTETHNGIIYKKGELVEYSFYDSKGEIRCKGELDDRHGHLSVHAIPLYVLINQNDKRKVKKI